MSDVMHINFWCSSDTLGLLQIVYRTLSNRFDVTLLNYRLFFLGTHVRLYHLGWLKTVATEVLSTGTNSSRAPEVFKCGQSFETLS